MILVYLSWDRVHLTLEIDYYPELLALFLHYSNLYIYIYIYIYIYEVAIYTLAKYT